MLLEPAFEYNGTGVYEYDAEYPRWRHMKYVLSSEKSWFAADREYWTTGTPVVCWIILGQIGMLY